MKEATKHFKLCLQSKDTPGQSGAQREDKDGAQNCTPLPCKDAAAPGVSKGFGFIFILNGRCSSEMGVESPHGAFLKTPGS